MIHNIELPRFVVRGKTIEHIPEILENLELKNPVIVSGEKTYNILGKKVSEVLSCPVVHTTEATIEEVKKVEKFAEEKDAHVLIAVGGGSIIDTAKLASYNIKRNFISIPTATSHDGICSNRSTIKRHGEKASYKAHAPIAVFLESKILKEQPKRMYRAGIGDAVAKYTAVLDWRLAKGKEYYGDYAASLSQLCADTIIENADKMKDDMEFGISILAESLVSSGVAMCIAGSSRPASGAEHAFSHTIDYILGTSPAMHGEQVGLGTIMMAKHHNADWEKVKYTLRKLGAPVTAEEVGLSEKNIIKGLVLAKDIRERHTILSERPLDERSAEKLAKDTGVI